MDNNIEEFVMQGAIVQKFERVAAKVAGRFQNRFHLVTEAHRRDRFIEWISYDDELWANLSAGCFPNEDSYSEEMERVIWGRYYDGLTDDEIRSVEKVIRRKDPGFYFDDSNDANSICYYADGMLDIRNQWSHKISGLAECARELVYKHCIYNWPKRADDPDDDPGDEEYNRQFYSLCAQRDANLTAITVAAMKYSPAGFICDTCGHLRHSHDETGHPIADIGMWTLSTGQPASYLVCEECADKPEVTQSILARIFVERESFRRLEEERERRELEDLLRGMGIDPKTGDPIDPQPDPTGSASSGQTTSTPGGASGSQSGVFKFLSFADLLILPSKTWLIDDFIGPRDMAMLYGEPSSGKTFLAIDLVFAACLGHKWAGHFNISRPLSVAYCAGEGVAGLRDRFDVAKDFWQVSDLPNFWIVPLTPQLYIDALNVGISSFANEWQAQHSGQTIDLLIIDTYQTATIGLEENSSKDNGTALQNLRNTINKLKCATLLIHHTDKNGVNYRGSSSLHGAMDAMFKAKAGAVSNTLECTKLKDGVPCNPLKYKITAKGQSARIEWNPTPFAGATQQVIALRDRILDILRDDPSKRLTVAQIHDLLADGARSTVKDTLDALCIEKRVVKQKKGKATNSPMEYWLDDAMDAALSALGK